MGDYHDDLYLKTDIFLLADVFEKIINTCLEYYGLDPCHYFSSPGLSWDAMLKMTEIELGLISDIDSFYLLKKEWEEVFLTLLKDLIKQINTWSVTMTRNQVNILCIWV